MDESQLENCKLDLNNDQQFPLQNDLTYSNYYKFPKIVYDENFNSLILQQKIYLRKTNNINMLDFRFVNLFKQNTVISTG